MRLPLLSEAFGFILLGYVFKVFSEPLRVGFSGHRPELDFRGYVSF